MYKNLKNFARHHTRKFIAITAATCLVLGAGATTAAITISQNGTSVIGEHFIARSTATLVPTTAGWHTIPDTTFHVTVPDGKLWLVNMAFSAESICSDASYCSIRAVGTSSENGTTLELFPESGTNFVFDSGGVKGARSFNRVIEVNGGSEGIQYTFQLQAQIIGGSSTSVFRLDDYLTQLELSNGTV